MARDLRTNNQIRVREVRLIGAEGEQLGITPLQRALELAQEAGLDLVEIAPTADPPVAKLLDYGKFKYEQAKRDSEARKHQSRVELREVRMKTKIGQHDIDFKTRTARKLLNGGDKVKLSVMFRGREITHPEIGRGLLDRIMQSLGDIAVVERPPMLEGRFMSMIVSPNKALKQSEKAKAEAVAQAEQAVANG
ncbi:MAG TPA: translation initiation factor IF-3 [Dehalococcoidia bacterium]|nr:translation initiation factor IF-3 [Dehalococcoidia bacterium]